MKLEYLPKFYTRLENSPSPLNIYQFLPFSSSLLSFTPESYLLYNYPFFFLVACGGCGA